MADDVVAAAVHDGVAVQAADVLDDDRHSQSCDCNSSYCQCQCNHAVVYPVNIPD